MHSDIEALKKTVEGNKREEKEWQGDSLSTPSYACQTARRACPTAHCTTSASLSRTCPHTHTHTHTHTRFKEYVCMLICVHVMVCTRVSLCACTHTHTHTHTHSHLLGPLQDLTAVVAQVDDLRLLAHNLAVVLLHQLTVCVNERGRK